MEKRIVILIIFLGLFSNFTFGKSPINKFFSRTDKFFKKYVESDLVNYKSIRTNPKELNELVASVQTLPFEKESVEIQKAYLINVYNLLVIKSIVDLPFITFPLESRGLFSGLAYKVSGQYYTLNDIEARLGLFKDVRVLFVLTPASIGSPALASFAYTPDKLEKQMEDRIKTISNNEEFLRVAKNISTILLTEAFICSQRNFPSEDLLNWLNKYREEPLPKGYRIDYFPCNRNLNTTGAVDW